jgi:hypothetical protein
MERFAAIRGSVDRVLSVRPYALAFNRPNERVGIE